MGTAHFETIPKAILRATRCVGFKLFTGQRSFLARKQRCIHSRIMGIFARLCIPNDSLGIIEFFIGKESCLTTAYSQPWLTVYFTVVVEEEETNIALLGMTIDMNVVLQRFAGLREITMVSEFATEQSIDSIALV